MSDVFAYVVQVFSSLPRWVQLVSIGGLIGSSFLHTYFVPLLFFGMWLLWQQLISAPSIMAAIGRGWLVWCVKAAFAVSWFLDTYPLDSISVTQPASVQFVGISVYLLTAALWLSSAGALLGLGVWLVERFVPRMVLKLSLLSVWLVLCEVLGAFTFSLATLAPGISLQSAFAFGFVGLPAVVIPGLIGWTYFGGIYIVSALVALYTLRIAYWQPGRGWWWVVGGAALLMCGGWFIGHFMTTSPSITTTVAVVETDFSAALLATPGGRSEQVEALRSAFTAALKTNPQYVLFPEGAGFIAGLYPNVDPTVAYNYYRFDFADPSTIVIDSMRHELADGSVLRGVTYDGVHKVVSQFDKQYLVPQGEYVPSLYGTVLDALGLTDLVATMRYQQSYIPGPFTTPTAVTDQMPPILFCFASSDPLGVRRMNVTAATPFVAHPVAHAWFHTPTALWYQLDQFLRIQGVWNHVPIVSAGNLAPSKVYWPDGSVTVGPVVAEGDLWRVRLVTLP